MNLSGGEGAEVVYPLRSNDTLAKSILEAIGEEGQLTRRYYQRRLPENPSKDYYYIMRETPNTTSLLIEYGFIDNPNDARKLQNNLLDYAEAVVRAVSEYIGIPYVSPGIKQEGTYTVKRGDSLYSIAQQYNTTVSELKRLNNLTSNTLQIGQVLTIPGKQESTIPTGTTTYIVQSGDSLWKIANQYNTTIDNLIKLNNLGTTFLQVGQQLLVPSSNSSSQYYTVQRGDSLWKIANQFNVNVNDLINANNLTSTVLQVGQQLIIPTTTTQPQPTPSSPSEQLIEYVVKRGDSLWTIANQYNTTVNELKRLNNITSNLLQVGQVLLVPSSDSSNRPDYSNTYSEYEVQRGDSLWSIARAYNTTVQQIKDLNNLDTDFLQIGQKLRIPM